MKIKNSLILTALLAFQAYAQDYSLQKTVVTASGFEQQISDAPASMSIVSHEQLENEPVRDFSDALKSLPGIDVSNSKTGSGLVSIRGFSSKYTAFLIDGKRQNSSQAIVNNGFDPNGSFMPPVNFIERIEVIRGPSSTLYGSDAIGGVVNVITKKNPDTLTGSISLDTKLQEHPGSYGNAFAYSGFIAIPLIKDSLSLSLRGRSYKKLTDGITQPNLLPAGHSSGDYDLDNIGGRLNYTINKNHNIYFDAEHYQEVGSTNNTSSKSIRSQKTWDRNNAVLNYDGTYDLGDLNAYMQFNETVNTANKSSDVTNGPLIDRPLSALYSKNYIIEAKMVTPLDFNSIGAMNLTYGAQLWHERYRNDSNANIAGHDLLQNTSSIYSESEYFITEKLTSTFGARFMYSNRFGSHISPRLYLVHKTTDNLSLKAGVATGYYSPTIPQSTDGPYQGNEGSEMTYGNKNLKPEESVNYEISAINTFENIGIFTTTLFYSDFKNKIINETYATNDQLAGGFICKGSECYVPMNVDRSKTYGVEFLFQTDSFYNFNLQGSYTYTTAKISSGEDKGAPLSEIPRHTLSMRLNYAYNDFNAYLKYTAKIRTPVTNTKTGPNREFYENYQLFDLGLNYTLYKKHHFAFVINNLFDKNFNVYDLKNNNGKVSYGNIFSDYIEGRSYWFSYSYQF